jgi:hypothetical protein
MPCGEKIQKGRKCERKKKYICIYILMKILAKRHDGNKKATL